MSFFSPNVYAELCHVDVAGDCRVRQATSMCLALRHRRCGCALFFAMLCSCATPLGSEREGGRETPTLLHSTLLCCHRDTKKFRESTHYYVWLTKTKTTFWWPTHPQLSKHKQKEATETTFSLFVCWTVITSTCSRSLCSCM